MTDIDMNSFVLVEKVNAPRLLDAGELRVTAAAISIGSGFAEPLIKKSKDKKTYINFEYSASARALRLTEANNGYCFEHNLRAHTLKTNNLPHAFKELHVPRGTYRQLEGHNNIFVLSSEASGPARTTPRVRYMEEPTDAAVGDIVSWIDKSKLDKQLRIVTGIVRSTVENTNPEVEKIYNVEPYSTAWYKGREKARAKLALVAAHELIIREKRNG